MHKTECQILEDIINDHGFEHLVHIPISDCYHLIYRASQFIDTQTFNISVHCLDANLEYYVFLFLVSFSHINCIYVSLFAIGILVNF